MSKYNKLCEHLAALSGPEWRAGFLEIEKVLGFTLPASARQYSAWWSNDATQSRHASAWLTAGWRTEDLNLTGETVTFRRSGAPGTAVKRKSGRPSRNSQQAAAAFDSETLPAAPGFNPLQMSVDMTWRVLGSLTAGEDGALIFPAVPDIPGLYRFRLIDAESARHYIGETVRLRRRFYHYSNPGPSQQTNIRINALLKAHLATGERIDIDIVTEGATMTMAGDTVQADFKVKAARRLFEHAAIVAEGGEEIESLNR